jgi:hypothetical protein
MGNLTRQLSCWCNKEDALNLYIVCIVYGALTRGLTFINC